MNKARRVKIRGHIRAGKRGAVAVKAHLRDVAPEKAHERTITLWRASDSPGEVRSGGHFTEERDHAEAYLNNPGYGGKHLASYRVRYSNDKVARTDDLQDLAEIYVGALSDEEREDVLWDLAPDFEYIEDFDERREEQRKWMESPDFGDIQQKWKDQGLDWVHDVLENDPSVEEAIEEKYDWIVFPDSYPEDATTWKLLSGSERPDRVVASTLKKATRLMVRRDVFEQLRKADRLPGGAADDVDHDTLDQDALKDGKKHELEHTDDPELAEEIAADHIVEEGDDYYKKLSALEKARIVIRRLLKGEQLSMFGESNRVLVRAHVRRTKTKVAQVVGHRRAASRRKAEAAVSKWRGIESSPLMRESEERNEFVRRQLRRISKEMASHGFDDLAAEMSGIDSKVAAQRQPKPARIKVKVKVKAYDGAKHAKRLRASADKLQPRIDQLYVPSEQNWTPKRGRQTASNIMGAEMLEKFQGWLRTFADHAEAGTLHPSLQALKSKAAIEDVIGEYNTKHPASVPPHHWRDFVDDMTKPAEYRWQGDPAVGVEKEGAIVNAWVAANPPKDPNEPHRTYAIVPLRVLEAAHTILKAAPTERRSRASGWVTQLVTEGKRAHKAGIRTQADWDAAREQIGKLAAEAKQRFEQGPGFVSPDKRALQEKLEAAKGLKIPGYFPTPKPVRDVVLARADLQKGQRVLEPSAGKGDIANHIRDEHPDVDLHVGEYNHTLHELLDLQGHELVSRDFLSYNPGEIYDRVVQNPPFEGGQDIDHVLHAYDLLKPGGRLVSVMGAGAFFRTQKKDVAFRTWLESVGWSEELPAGSFKHADRSTGVSTRIVVIDKPEG